jgi:oxidase EvaA
MHSSSTAAPRWGPPVPEGPSLAAWLAQRRAASGLTVERISFAECAGWTVTDREVRHRSGRFFQVVAVHARGGAYDGWARPMLRQTEVGLLGFVARPRPGGGYDVLVQAKSEPGNVGGTQLAPTVQATRSNYERVHGGGPTRYLEWFTEPVPGRVLSDVVASEQGTRFLGKLNRNCVVRAEGPDAPCDGGSWRWFPAPALRAALARDFLVNTDARSVLATGPWSLLAGDGRPFARWEGRGGFGERLAASYRTVGGGEAAARAVLGEARSACAIGVEQVRFADLEGWRVGDRGIEPDGNRAGVSVAYVAVRAADREVGAWHQPLLRTVPATCDLWCQEHDGLLRFAFRPSAEPGLRHRVELGPTHQSDVPGAGGDLPAGAAVRLAARQSDEGGRFLRSVCRYRIVELPPAVPCAGGRAVPGATTEGCVWLTAAEIERLAAQPAAFTNEARSAISVLLSLA